MRLPYCKMNTKSVLEENNWKCFKYWRETKQTKHLTHEFESKTKLNFKKWKLVFPNGEVPLGRVILVRAERTWQRRSRMLRRRSRRIGQRNFRSHRIRKPELVRHDVCRRKLLLEVERLREEVRRDVSGVERQWLLHGRHPGDGRPLRQGPPSDLERLQQLLPRHPQDHGSLAASSSASSRRQSNRPYGINGEFECDLKRQKVRKKLN